jgi:hypothetical protein
LREQAGDEVVEAHACDIGGVEPLVSKRGAEHPPVQAGCALKRCFAKNAAYLVLDAVRTEHAVVVGEIRREAQAYGAARRVNNPAFRPSRRDPDLHVTDDVRRQ